MKNKKMKIARVEKDMNQEDLAKAVGVTRQTIGMIESGNYNPTLKLCLAICKALDNDDNIDIDNDINIKDIESKLSFNESLKNAIGKIK